VEIVVKNRDNESVLICEMGGIVKRSLVVLGILVGGALAAGSGIVLGQDAGKKASGAAKGGTNAAAVARGKDLFQQKCALCHYDTSDQKKIGPGLKGLNKRGTFTVNGNKVTDDNLRTWIENGDQLMPPFKDVLEAGQIKDVVAYVRTL
jgi:cytochrome c